MRFTRWVERVCLMHNKDDLRYSCDIADVLYKRKQLYIFNKLKAQG